MANDKWTLTIEGKGPHHNLGDASDADVIMSRSVDEFSSRGHRIDHASITCGDRQAETRGAQTTLTEVRPEAQVDPELGAGRPVPPDAQVASEPASADAPAAVDEGGAPAQ